MLFDLTMAFDLDFLFNNVQIIISRILKHKRKHLKYQKEISSETTLKIILISNSNSSIYNHFWYYFKNHKTSYKCSFLDSIFNKIWMFLKQSDLLVEKQCSWRPFEMPKIQRIFSKYYVRPRRIHINAMDIIQFLLIPL